MNRVTMILGGLILLAAASTGQAGWSVGVRFGGPVYHRPYHGPWCGPYPYYRPYPIVVAPPPILLAPAPVVAVQPAPVVVGSPAETPEPVAAPRLQPVARAASQSSNDLAALNDPSEQTRADAIVERGRNKDRQAVAPITKALHDPSPTVREAAAGALGLIALPGSLNALQNAAQSDPDRDVRRSAAFAADIIRANMPR